MEAARAAGASTYAAEELKAAEAALAGYETAVSQGDYRLALSLAIDARERAYAATRRASDEKTRARVQAEQLIATVESGVVRIEERLAGKTGPQPNRQTAARLSAKLKTSTVALQKARSRMTAEDYHAVVTLLSPVREALDADLASATPSRARVVR